MASGDEPTGFEWLDRPFMLTRIWVTLLATFVLVLLAYQMISILMFVRLGPPPPPRITDGGEETDPVKPTSCGPERKPIQVLAGMATYSVLIASSIALVWLRPRVGFLLAAVIGPPFWMLLGFLPSAWLCFAAWKAGRPPPRDILAPCD